MPVQLPRGTGCPAHVEVGRPGRTGTAFEFRLENVVQNRHQPVVEEVLLEDEPGFKLVLVVPTSVHLINGAIAGLEIDGKAPLVMDRVEQLIFEFDAGPVEAEPVAVLECLTAAPGILEEMVGRVQVKSRLKPIGDAIFELR